MTEDFEEGITRGQMFFLERVGQRARVRVNGNLSRQMTEALGLPPGDEADFSRCIDYMISQGASLAQHPSERIAAFSQHFLYYLDVMRDYALDPVAAWTPHGMPMEEKNIKFLHRYVPEFLDRVSTVALGWQPVSESPTVDARAIFEYLQQRSATQSSPLLRKWLPDAVLGLPSEANLEVLFKYFEASLTVPGDVCEFGCFRGLTSVKMAFLLKSLGQAKTVFAFDTFEGFQIDDPGQGALRKGAYSDTFDAFSELGKWANVLPVRPVKGDATVTSKDIKAPLSFVWLDLDMDVLMEPVLANIWPWIGPDTLIGIDDLGRPETPTVKPWVEHLLTSGRLLEVARHPNEFIGIFRRR